MIKKVLGFLWKKVEDIVGGVTRGCKMNTVFETTLCLATSLLILLLIPFLFILACFLFYLFLQWCIFSVFGHVFVLILIVVFIVSFLAALKIHS